MSNPFIKFVIQNEGKLIFLCTASWKVMKGPYSMQKHWRLPIVYCWNPLFVIPIFLFAIDVGKTVSFLSASLQNFILPYSYYPRDNWIVILAVFLKYNNKIPCFTKFLRVCEECSCCMAFVSQTWLLLKLFHLWVEQHGSTTNACIWTWWNLVTTYSTMEVTGLCVHPECGSVGTFYSLRIQKWLNWSPKVKLYCT